MSEQRNQLGQPIGFLVAGWTARPRPPRTPLVGRFCRVEPIDVGRHAADLYAANAPDEAGRMWTYMAYGPFATKDDYVGWMTRTCLGEDPLFHAIVDLGTERAVGVASYLRIDPGNGVIETGHIA
jgi:hypothetical protein